FFSGMPAYARNNKALGTKLLCGYPDNGKNGLPTHLCQILLFNPETGTLQAIMDGEVITEMRTAAASAVATNHLAKKDVKVLAILGSGTQARSHAEALKHIRSFTEVRVWSRTPANAKKFADEIQAQCCTTVKEAVAGADVIVTATFAENYVLEGKWVKQGAVINAVGAARPHRRELDDDVMLNSFVVADSMEAAMAESGDVVQSKATVVGEIGDVIAGKIEVPKDKTIVFKSLGIGVQDIVSAKLVYDKLVEQGIMTSKTCPRVTKVSSMSPCNQTIEHVPV
ncbi:hypothetical protein QZH41_015170, partial [Actinostola sp. cb2023]